MQSLDASSTSNDSLSELTQSKKSKMKLIDTLDALRGAGYWGAGAIELRHFCTSSQLHPSRCSTLIRINSTESVVGTLQSETHPIVSKCILMRYHYFFNRPVLLCEYGSDSKPPDTEITNSSSGTCSGMGLPTRGGGF